MTKAEAQAKASPVAADAKKAKAKEAIVVPPMPVKPAYAKPAPPKPSKEQVAERRAFHLRHVGAGHRLHGTVARRPPLGRSAPCGSCSRTFCASRRAGSTSAPPTSSRPARSKSDSRPSSACGS